MPTELDPRLSLADEIDLQANWRLDAPDEQESGQQGDE